MPLFRLLSDLHSEYYDDIESLLNKIDFNPIVDKESYLLLAGDIGHALDINSFPNIKYYNLLRELRSRFKGVILVSGNHEYYNGKCQCCYENKTHCFKCFAFSQGHFDINKIDKVIRNFCDDLDIHFLQKNSIEIEGITIYGCTLFPLYENCDLDDINDFKNITPYYSDLYNVHVDHKNWLTNIIFPTNSILMTHFLTHKCFVHPRYKRSKNNGAFLCDVFNQLKNKPKVCICGHSHEVMKHFENGTTFYLNPSGYPDEKHVTPREVLRFYL